MLRDYQIDHLAFHMAHKRTANTSDPGTGKTPTVCVWMYWLWSSLGFKTIWTMPKSLMKKNKRELLKFSEFKEDEVQIIDGTPKQRAEQMANPNAKVFICGFKRFSDDWETIKRLHPKTNAVCIDEVHMGFKSNDSARTGQLYRCMKKMEYFLAMSGTLVAGRLDSAYPTIHIIEPRYYAGYGQFLSYHGVYDYNNSIVAWKNHEKIGQILSTHAVRMTAKECFGNEEPVIQQEICEMLPKHRKAYDEFEKFAMLEIGDGETLEAFNPGPHTIRCRQIMAHPAAMGILKVEELTGKEEALVVHLEDHKARGEPLLIYAVFKEEVNRLVQIVKEFGLTCGQINSDINVKLRDVYDLGFQTGEYQVMVVSPETASVGYNWGHVNHIIFASLDYQDVNLTQAIRRAIRGIRTCPLIVTVLEYENSIDQVIYKVVNRKSSDLNKVDGTYSKIQLGKPPSTTAAVDMNDLVALRKRLSNSTTEKGST